MTSSSTFQSRLPILLQNFQTSLQKIDTLERSLEEKVAEKRTRAVNLLDEIPSYRQSTLRLFITHQCADETLQVPIPDPLTGEIDPNSELKKEVKRNKWNLVIEGRLLVGHLDHESAAAVDEYFTIMQEQQGKRYVTHSDTVVDVTDMTTRERAQTRFIHDREGEEPLAPIKFAHFFERISVSFQTYQKRKTHTNQMVHLEQSSSKSARVKRKSSSRSSLSPDTPSQSKKKIVYHSDGVNTTLFWNRQRPNVSTTSGGASTSPIISLDTNAFHAIYSEEKEPEQMENTVVATIRLHRRQGEPRYKPSDAFVQAILPYFHPKKLDIPALNQMYVNAPPMDNDIQIPRVLTMDEAMDAIYLYSKEKNLLDEANLGSIINDAKLESLFECKIMTMHQVKEWLLSKGHLAPVIVGTPGDAPVVLTYIMTKDNATESMEEDQSDQTNHASEHESGGEALEPDIKKRRMLAKPQTQENEPVVFPNLLSCDIDVDVPHLYHIRTRDILRRIKIREYEYAQGRTAALRSIEQSGANEDIVKEYMDHILRGKAYTKYHIPVLMALAKMAPEGSEARQALHIDMQTACLIDRVEHHVAKVKALWKIVERCRNVNDEFLF